MRKRFYYTIAVTAILSIVPFVSSAQSSVSTICGIVLGVDAPSTSVTELTKELPTKDQIGYHVGIMMGFDFSFIDIVPELIYVNNKLKFNETSIFKGKEFVSQSIEVPILASIRLLKFLDLKAGPSFSIYNEATMKMVSGDEVDLGRVKSSTGYVVGVGTSISRLMLDVRYNGQFNSTKTMWGIDNIPASREVEVSSFSVTVGYRF